MTEEKYVFNSHDDIVKYLVIKFGELTPLKLQKGLYFLYAYYGALYGSKKADGELEENFQMPKELFPADFEAWTYGPVIREVYRKYNQKQYDKIEIEDSLVEEISNKYPKAIDFINDMFEQINSLSDFTLVDRSHEDKSWSDAYSKGKSTIIENKNIIQEYKEKYV